MPTALKKNWLDRALEAAESCPEALATARETLGNVLAAAPVEVEPEFPALVVADREAATVRVTLFPVYAQEPAQSYREMRRVFFQGGDASEELAGLRAHYADAHDYGPTVRVAAELPDGNGFKRVILEGSLAAVRHAAPDRETIKALRRAGVVEYTVANGEVDLAGVTLRRYKRVPLEQAPRPLQMEHESRGIEAAEKAARKAAAIAALASDDIRAELAQAQTRGRLNEFLGIV